MFVLRFDPVTLRECFAYWLCWRFMAAHAFVLWAMRTNPDTRDGNQNIMAAPIGWYIPRACAGWRLGKPWILRVRREYRKL